MSDRKSSEHPNKPTSAFDLKVQLDRVCWEDISKNGLSGTRLLATLRFNGVNHHLEGIRVSEDPKSEHGQSADCPSCEDILFKYRAACEAEGPFHTVRINGFTYVLIVTPFCY